MCGQLPCEIATEGSADTSVAMDIIFYQHENTRRSTA